MNLSSPEKVAAFKHARGLANDGRWAEALDAYNNVFDYAPKQINASGEKSVLSSDLIGLTEIYKADCLGHLGRFEEAKKRLDEPMLATCVKGFVDLSYLWHYYFVYGNILGSMGDMVGMNDKLTRALKIAADELGDAERCEESWLLMLTYANKNQAWQNLLDTAMQAKQFSVNASLEVLGFRANECLAYAYQGLGDINNARIVAKQNLDTATLHKSQEAINRWESILASL